MSQRDSAALQTTVVRHPSISTESEPRPGIIAHWSLPIAHYLCSHFARGKQNRSQKSRLGREHSTRKRTFDLKRLWHRPNTHKKEAKDCQTNPQLKDPESVICPSTHPLQHSTTPPLHHSTTCSRNLTKKRADPGDNDRGQQRFRESTAPTRPESMLPVSARRRRAQARPSGPPER